MELKVPAFGESVVEGTIVRWLKDAGAAVKVDEPVVEIETDKITVEVPAPAPGVLSKRLKAVGEKVQVGEVIGEVDTDAKAAASTPATKGPRAVETPRPEAQRPEAQKTEVTRSAPLEVAAKTLMPAARRVAEERGIDVSAISGSGRGGRVLKEDVLEGATISGAATAVQTAPRPIPELPTPRAPRAAHDRERRVAMSPMRQRIAQRLLEAQSNAAMLTTFNECDMGHVMELRKRYQDGFTARHGVKLGFMSFFIKAAVEALEAFPAVNAEIDGSDIVYKDYYDIGVAVGGGKGLVVPVIRDANLLSFAEVEKTIGIYGQKAKDNKLSLAEMSGGTFTISNGGIYGSMMSTPILNPPQSGILGMHAITERAMVQGGQVTVRPMMYLALSYDHRLVDGREAVQFLVRIKECIENPERLLLEV